jgi:uncharacterized membrane protein SpoIIM required for sporulation
MATAASDRSVAAAGATAPVGLMLKSSEFRRAREGSWRELDAIIERAEKRGARALSLEDLQRMALFYRSTLSSLSVARAIALDRHLLLFLENLALRAFLVVYGPRTRLLDACVEFLRHGFPAAVRASRWQVAVALLSLLVGTIAGFMLVATDESWFATLVPSGLADGRGPASTRASLLEQELFAPWRGSAAMLALIANFLFTHNSLVGLLTFCLGFAAGVPTLLLMAYQGLLLGAFLALHHARGLTIDFLGWLLIHGVTELGAIILCGAAGLVIASKILFPDRYSRLDSLALHGRMAGQIAVGAAFMFFVAALLEGGLRQPLASTPGRFAIAAITALAWSLYFVRAGRTR